MNKRILFIAPNSIPINGPEAIVNAKLLKALIEEDHQIDLISRDSPNKYIESTYDEIFSKGLCSFHCISVDNYLSLNSIYYHLRVLLKTGFVYKGAHWAYRAIKKAEELLTVNNYDYVFSRSPSSELAALYLSRKYNIKWVANWNDPYPKKRMPVPYGQGAKGKLSFFENKLLKKVANYPYIHLFNTQRQRDYMLQYMDIDISRTMIVPHICLDNLFVKEKLKKLDKLLLIHSGNVSYPRNPESFLKGLRLFLNENPNASIEINFIGKQTDDFHNLVIEYNLGYYVKEVPSMPYIANLSFIYIHHVAILIEAPSENSVFLPTKLGDYMQCGRKIFAVSPANGVLNDLYREKKISYFADCTNADEVCETLKDIYQDYQNLLMNNGDIEIIEEYKKENIIQLYNKIIY